MLLSIRKWGWVGEGKPSPINPEIPSKPGILKTEQKGNEHGIRYVFNCETLRR